MVVKGRLEFVIAQSVGGFPDAGFEDVEISDHAVVDQARFGEKVHADGVAFVFQFAEA